MIRVNVIAFTFITHALAKKLGSRVKADGTPAHAAIVNMSSRA